MLVFHRLVHGDRMSLFAGVYRDDIRAVIRGSGCRGSWPLRQIEEVTLLDQLAQLRLRLAGQLRQRNAHRLLESRKVGETTFCLERNAHGHVSSRRRNTKQERG